MKLSQQYQEVKLKDFAKQDLQDFIEEEVVSLWNDFGQKMDEEQLKHIGSRLYEVFTTKYRSWAAGTIHASFQAGLNGAYGSSYKIHVKTLFHWLASAQKQMSHIKSIQAEQESERNKNFAPKDNTIETEFIAWATGEMICLEYLDPTHDPMQTRRVSPKVTELAKQYQKVKNNETSLFNFRAKLRERNAETAKIS